MKSSLAIVKLPLACAAALCLGSCASSSTWRAPWVYALSRSVYDSDAFGEVSGGLLQESGCGEKSAMVVAIVFVAPFALDTLFLPVTLPHDVLFVE